MADSIQDRWRLAQAEIAAKTGARAVPASDVISTLEAFAPDLAAAGFERSRAAAFLAELKKAIRATPAVAEAQESSWTVTVSGAGVRVSLPVLAGENLSAHRAVVVRADGKAWYFDPADRSLALNLCGVTQSSAVAGVMADIVFCGYLEGRGIGFLAGAQYFATANGQLSTTPPASGVERYLGAGLANDAMCVMPGPPLYR